MTFTSKWYWPVLAGAAILLSAAAALLLRNTWKPVADLPEESVSSYEIFAENVQLRISADSAVSEEDPVPEALPDTGYVLKLDGDTLYVYEEGVKKPVAEYDLPAGWLPDYDRILLEYGFRAANKDELRQLLEDYVS